MSQGGGSDGRIAPPAPSLGRSLLASPLTPVFVGILLRAILVAQAPFTPSGGDADAYLYVGRHLRETGAIPAERGLPAVMPPLYPILIALTGMTGDRAGVLLLKLLNIASGAVAIAWTGRLGLILWGRRTGHIAAWLTALHPMLLLYARDVSTESLFLPLLLGGLLLLQRIVRELRFRRAVAFGVVLGLGALLRPACLPGGAAGLLVALMARSNARWRRRAAIACTAGLATLAILAPWSAYLTATFHEPMLLTDTGGFNFWDGHHPLNFRIAQERDQARRDALAATKDAERRAIVAACAAEGCTRGERSERFRRDAWARMDEGGASFAWHSAANFWGVWKAWPDPVAHSRALSVALGAFLVPLTLLGIGGAGIAVRRRRTRPLALASIAGLLALTAAAVWYVGTFRYRFGHVDPVLMVFAPGPLVWLRRFRSSRSHPTPV